jgi:hypothetical protein
VKKSKASKNIKKVAPPTKSDKKELGEVKK